MRMSTIWHLARKEILSTFRDRRALLSNIAIPLVLMPVMMLGMPLLLGGIFESETVNVTPVAVEGAGNLPGGLRDLMERSEERRVGKECRSRGGTRSGRE